MAPVCTGDTFSTSLTQTTAPDASGAVVWFSALRYARDRPPSITYHLTPITPHVTVSHGLRLLFQGKSVVFFLTRDTGNCISTS